MKKSLLSFLLCVGPVFAGSAQTTEQTLFFDFGTVTASQGTVTEGADINGNHWNNITNNVSGNKYAASGTVYDNLVNSADESTGYSITLNSRFSTNGKSGGGGLLNPDASLLGDLAVASATEDYFFIESSENNSNFTISGLDPQRGYRFHIFASRKAGDTRTGIYKMEGINSFAGELQLAGTNLGGEGINQNIADILVSDPVFPDDNGEILFTVSRKTGAYIALNAMKVEEISGLERPGAPAVVVSAALEGTAAENGERVTMHLVSPDGKNNGIFECFTMLKPGAFRFGVVTDKEENLTYGIKNGKVSADADAGEYAVDAEQLSMVKVDFSTGELKIVPITSWGLTGSVVPGGWSLTDNALLEYKGAGVWSATLDLDRVSTVSDPERFVFVMNKSWDYQMKHVAGTDRSVGFASDGFTLNDIRLNHGRYTITLDLDRFIFDIESPDGIDPYRISVMGSSVANGQGATDNHGYAYMYGQLLQERSQGGLSEHPFHTSGISVNGNSTVNLLARYNDLIHDFGQYVIFGVSLGNEGIHGAADQEAVFNQFRDNMQLLISKAREDGKIPVVMNNYTRGDFEVSDYEYVRRMNLLINSWDLPSVNLLGAIDNGAGKWADGYQNGDDIYHPSTEGHAEFFYAIPPSLFDAIHAGKPLPVRQTGNSMIIGKNGKVEFEPENIVHPFTVVIGLNQLPAGTFATIETASGTASISLEDDQIVYTSPSGQVISGSIDASSTSDRSGASGNRNLNVALTHYHAQGRTLLYAGDRLIGETAGKIAPVKVSVAPSTGNLDLSEVMFYRSALNADEIGEINAGTMIKSSMEVYLPFSDSSEPGENHAQSMNTVTVNPGTSSVTSVSTDNAPDLQARGLTGAVSIAAGSPIEVVVCTPDGRVCYDGTVEQSITLPLPAGLYLVNSQKVIVK